MYIPGALLGVQEIYTLLHVYNLSPLSELPRTLGILGGILGSGSDWAGVFEVCAPQGYSAGFSGGRAFDIRRHSLKLSGDWAVQGYSMGFLGGILRGRGTPGILGEGGRCRDARQNSLQDALEGHPQLRTVYHAVSVRGQEPWRIAHSHQGMRLAESNNIVHPPPPETPKPKTLNPKP